MPPKKSPRNSGTNNVDDTNTALSMTAFIFQTTQQLAAAQAHISQLETTNQTLIAQISQLFADLTTAQGQIKDLSTKHDVLEKLVRDELPKPKLAKPDTGSVFSSNRYSKQKK